VKDYAPACAPSECDAALATDCTSVAGMLSDPYLDALSDCMKSGGAPTSCLVSSIPALQPTDAQRAFAQQFCSECLLGVPGCEEAFFGGQGDAAIAGNLILPLGDSLVDQLRMECASGLTCAATFSTCAEKVFAERAIPTATATCLVSSWVDGSSSGRCGGGATTSSASSSPTTTSSGNPATTTSGGGVTTGVTTGGSTTSSTTATTTTGGNTCMPSLPASLADTDDCDDTLIPIHGFIDASASQFVSHHVADASCLMQPFVQTTAPADLQVCQYFYCDSGTTDVSCPPGTLAATNIFGDPGCCGIGQINVNYDCDGTLDDSVTVSYEIKPYPSCTEYYVHVAY
jgi:hypothetical protein